MIGLTSHDLNDPKIDFRRVVAFSLPLLSTILTALVHFMLNIHQINKATDSLHPFCAFFILLTMHWHLLVNRTRFIQLIDDMNEIVNERM